MGRKPAFSLGFLGFDLVGPAVAARTRGRGRRGRRGRREGRGGRGLRGFWLLGRLGSPRLFLGSVGLQRFLELRELDAPAGEYAGQSPPGCPEQHQGEIAPGLLDRKSTRLN